MATRKILVAVDDSNAAEQVLEWTISQMYKEGDEIHLLHIIPTPMQDVIGAYGAMDSIITVDPDPKVDAKHIAEAKEMMSKRFVTKCITRNIPYAVEIVHYLTDRESIGEALCKRADALNAAALCMAKHNRGAINEFFLGSTTKYATLHCKAPLVVLHCE